MCIMCQRDHVRNIIGGKTWGVTSEGVIGFLGDYPIGEAVLVMSALFLVYIFHW